MIEPEPLQQIERTYVRFRGRKLSYFAGCDYFRLSSHPQVIAALAQGAKLYGLNVSASRMTSGNHRLYLELEKALTRFFDAPAALLVPTGYLSNLVLAQTLAGSFSHVLIDERAHASLQDAARLLECPVLQFAHRNPEHIAACVQRCGPGAKLVLLTDGLFAHDGSVAPLAAYAVALPKDALLWVDDAHGAGVLGRTGKGSLEYAGLGRQRVVQTITLSKAFGTYGGAVLCAEGLRRQILERSQLFTGSTPLPLPLANAALTAVRLLRNDRRLRQRLATNVSRVKMRLRAAGISAPETPGPIISLVPRNEESTRRLRRVLLQAGIYPSSLVYPVTSRKRRFRFAISSEHSGKQLEQLLGALIQVLKAGLAGWGGIG